MIVLDQECVWWLDNVDTWCCVVVMDRWFKVNINIRTLSPVSVASTPVSVNITPEPDNIKNVCSDCSVEFCSAVLVI